MISLYIPKVRVKKINVIYIVYNAKIFVIKSKINSKLYKK